MLYMNGSAFIWDITEGGKNNCSGANGYDSTTKKYTYNCCPEGFPTTKGWDAATGLGSVDYEQFFNTYSESTPLPSATPTFAPTAVPSYSFAPSKLPTMQPTRMPTQLPTTDANINSNSSNDDNTISEGAIAGIVIGGVIGVGVLVGVVYYFFFMAAKAPLASSAAI
jgi:hypothetical protein